MIEQLCVKVVLLVATREVFETMVFMSVEESQDSEGEIEGQELSSSITFKGDCEGCLAICCDTFCAQAIARNMLGLDTTVELSKEEICDAFGEVVNMVMGSVKKRLEDEFGSFEVSIPTVSTGRKIHYNSGKGVTELSIEVSLDDEYRAILTLLYRKNDEAVEGLTEEM